MTLEELYYKDIETTKSVSIEAWIGGLHDPAGKVFAARQNAGMLLTEIQVFFSHRSHDP
jgi:hypothetical protein